MLANIGAFLKKLVKVLGFIAILPWLIGIPLLFLAALFLHDFDHRAVVLVLVTGGIVGGFLYLTRHSRRRRREQREAMREQRDEEIARFYYENPEYQVYTGDDMHYHHDEPVEAPAHQQSEEEFYRV